VPGEPNPVEVVRRAIEAFSRRDVETIASELVHPEIDVMPMTATVQPRQARYTGVSGVIQFLNESAADWKESEVTPADLRAVDAENVLAICDVRLVPHKGEEMNIQTASLWTVEDGLITRLRGFPSLETALRAAGLE
jgi:ketosteroid isomerase-like protein